MAVVDIDHKTFIAIYNKRPDIGQYYAQFLQGNGTPWILCGLSTCATENEKVAIVTDWWLNTAGGDDNPEFYGGSLRSFAGTKLGIQSSPGSDTSGNPPIDTLNQLHDLFGLAIRQNGAYILLGFVALAIFATPRRRRRIIAPFKSGAAGGETTGLGLRGSKRLSGGLVVNPGKLRLVPYRER